MNCIRIGLFGGSFNPPHIGHIRAAKYFCQKANPDIFMVVPSFIAPHKEIQEIGPHHRVEMAKLAFSHIWDNTVISDCEIVRGGKSYTVITVNELKQKYPGCQICLFVGSDMFLCFENWYKAEILFESCLLYVMPRKDDISELMQKAEYYISKYNANITFIDKEFYEISSTELRYAIIENNIDFLSENLSTSVLNYIRQENLY
ncbi:MAG: nicotinate (nicotinamide) nucleotide adenylyltransferase [Clostridia bacterium]|nr:nicotinate (nicotinamide) nucleotide adenylyltransferase [Clostridia bacterium]